VTIAIGFTRRALLLATTLSALAALPAWADDGGVEVIDHDWVDAQRGRAVPVRLYWPAAAAAQGKVPLVVFSHGIGGSRFGYSYLGRHFAEQGIASLHLQHVGSDRSLWSGSGWSLLGRLHDAAQEREAVARVMDLRFALDRLLAGDNGAHIDAGRIVAAGHSYGANTTLLATGARVMRDGERLDLSDARIKAAIVISAPPFYGEAEPGKILAGVTVPTLHITATEDVIRIPGYYSAAADRVAVFDATGSPRKLLAVFTGGSHSVFTDRSMAGGATLNPQIKAATKELSLAFMKSVFDGDEGLLRAWPQRFGGLVTRFVGAH
jgi:dienelactone hydrolase